MWLKKLCSNHRQRVWSASSTTTTGKEGGLKARGKGKGARHTSAGEHQSRSTGGGGACKATSCSGKWTTTATGKIRGRLGAQSGSCRSATWTGGQSLEGGVKAGQQWTTELVHQPKNGGNHHERCLVLTKAPHHIADHGTNRVGITRRWGGSHHTVEKAGSSTESSCLRSG